MSKNLYRSFHGFLVRCLNRVLPSCQEVSRLVSASMDAQLPPRKRVAVRMHLLICSLCRRYRKQLRLLRTGARFYADPETNHLEDALPEEARARLQEKLPRSR